METERSLCAAAVRCPGEKEIDENGIATNVRALASLTLAVDCPLFKQLDDARCDFRGALALELWNQGAFRKAPKPSFLPPRELAGAGFDKFDASREGIGRANRFGEIIHDFAVTHGLRRRAAEAAVTGEKPTNLLDKSCGKHGIDPCVNTLMKLFAWPGEDEDFTLAGGVAFIKVSLTMAEGFSRNAKHFQSPDNSPLVIGMKLGGQQWVDYLQTLVQGG